MNITIYEENETIVKRTGDYDFEVAIESKPGDAINKACEVLLNCVDGEIWQAVTPTCVSSDAELDSKGLGLFIVYFHLRGEYNEKAL